MRGKFDRTLNTLTAMSSEETTPEEKAILKLSQEMKRLETQTLPPGEVGGSPLAAYRSSLIGAPGAGKGESQQVGMRGDTYISGGWVVETPAGVDEVASKHC